MDEAVVAMDPITGEVVDLKTDPALASAMALAAADYALAEKSIAELNDALAKQKRRLEESKAILAASAMEGSTAFGRYRVIREPGKKPARQVAPEEVGRMVEKLPPALQPTEQQCTACEGTGMVKVNPKVGDFDKHKDELHRCGLAISDFMKPAARQPDTIVVVDVGGGD